jgi:hypothetical protein
MNLISLVDKKFLKQESIDSRYEHSPFRYIKMMAPRGKGSRFEKIAKSIFKKLGKTVDRSSSTDHDAIVESQKVEIKGSTLIRNKNNFSFLQIRPDQDYDLIVFLMAYPNELKMITMSKSVVLKNIKNGIFLKQHGGSKANSGTFLYYGNFESLVSIGGIPVSC